MTSATELDRAADLIRNASALLVCAGAGMGVDSGLPDFRGTEGFWRAYPPYARLGLAFEELADPVHFGDDPTLAWGFYGHRLRLYRRTQPHHGFHIIRGWNKPTRVFTSNVDGAFQKAGFPAEHVAEVHGSIHHMQCFNRCGEPVWAAGEDVEIDEETMRAVGELPSCPGCGGLARPNILMFGDYDWQGERSEAILRNVAKWRTQQDNLAVIELGAGNAIPTVRRMSELASARSGALIRVNPREPEIRHGRGVALALGSLAALSELDTRIRAG
ncbi:NAD-dependent SIR2 family protein deacetylase [Kibdelosporangium banguiense]|uniref:protein acetyllysine N-acetyltransferase n=1 Tax=Kibdelosporangium banguiense TaxID=1365924 RepID=A0ABS4TAA3_9PSEU|nr:Sir2 family NAD-dependent protein deacetylase [Kibdelosporangium banguiense]MBP2321328.1 NAD-dependent SIR2 family protein deacetylase [Kibdelosporangium banguiense]